MGLADNIENQALVREAHKLILSYGWVDELFGVLTKSFSITCLWFSWPVRFGSPPERATTFEEKKS